MSGAGDCRDQHDSHLDDRTLDARDMAEEIAEARNGTQPREFPDVANEWLETCLAENRKAGISTDALLLIMRLGVLGQKLIYEANAIGMRDMVQMLRDTNHSS